MREGGRKGKVGGGVEKRRGEKKEGNEMEVKIRKLL